MVEEVKELGAELDAVRFPKPEVLHGGEIHLIQSRKMQFTSTAQGAAGMPGDARIVQFGLNYYF